MKNVIKHKDAIITIDNLVSGKKRISVELVTKDLFMLASRCETSYPLDLIDAIIHSNKGPSSLCDEIMRDEADTYVQCLIKYDLLSYIGDEEFKNKRLLDFGCGGGASSMILARMFPDTEIIGIDLNESSLSIARLRAKHYGFENIKFMKSPDPRSLPKDIGKFDYIMLSAVIEHLLPEERKRLLPMLWNSLKSNGVVFINQTPHRYFPIERHTTGGLPFVNYLPDKIALYCTRYFSKRKLKNCNWETLLRRGIRGSSINEIFDILKRVNAKPKLLEPFRLGLNSRMDIWYIQKGKGRYLILKKVYLFIIKCLYKMSGVILLPDIAIAIRKDERN